MGSLYRVFMVIAVLRTPAQVTEGGEAQDLPLLSKHQHLLSTLSHYEIVRPHRCTQNGGFLNDEVSTTSDDKIQNLFVKRTRKIRSSESRPEIEESANELHFRVDAFNGSFVLNVARDRHLTTPGLTVERYFDNGTKDTFKPDTTCFYSGSVNGVPDSSVALSSCDGLNGLIQTADDEYVIEPLELDHTVSEVNLTEDYLHVIYKTRDVRNVSRHDLETNFKLSFQNDHQGKTPRMFSETYRNWRRSGRSTVDPGRQYFVETALVADYSMVDFHGVQKLPTYLLTLLNIVNRIYRHSTIPVDIQFTATKIILLDQEISKSLVFENRYSRSMNNVFNWVSTLAPPGELFGIADYVSFVTAVDFGPAGYAPVATMCEVQWSSSITQDLGLRSAFVMAHEAGHVLGMSHDGDGNSCAMQPYARSIMNAVVMASFRWYFWSNCSAQLLKSRIGGYRCLQNVPFNTKKDSVESNGFPGEWYSPSQQCQVTFGADSRQCGQTVDYYNCAIRCTNHSNPYVCYDYHLTVLDGTSCGNMYTQWCNGGICEDKTPKQNGNWGEWSVWSECSSDCGVGAQTRHRTCDSPRPAFGGKRCKGRSLQYKVCNTTPCPVWVDKRAEQCTERLAAVYINDRAQTWLPHVNRNESSPCTLTCIAKRMQYVLGTPYLVTDGTPCSYRDQHSICVRGKCKKLGCDKRAGSTKSDDFCGICGGDNSDCTFVNRTFAQAPKKKYQKLAMLPVGAYNIAVKEKTNTSHFLALRVTSSKWYILNGGGVHRGWPAFVAGAARFDYSREDETLKSTGPLHEELDLMVYWSGDRRPVRITYSYYIKSAGTSPEE